MIFLGELYGISVWTNQTNFLKQRVMVLAIKLQLLPQTSDAWQTITLRVKQPGKFTAPVRAPSIMRKIRQKNLVSTFLMDLKQN